jgi:hypothetical protein
MVPKSMDSLDVVEAVMLIEEVFGTEIPDGDAETFGSPRDMVDWLELHLSNQRPSKRGRCSAQETGQSSQQSRIG